MSITNLFFSELQTTPVYSNSASPRKPVNTTGSPIAFYSGDAFSAKTQKFSFKPPSRNSIWSIYEWAGYEFCLKKSCLNEKTCSELKKKYKLVKNLPPDVDYNAIHSVVSLSPDLFENMLNQFRSFLEETQIVPPAKTESLFSYLERVQKCNDKLEKTRV